MTRKTSAHDALIARRVRFRGALLTWYRAHARRLPWRESPSLYKTVVSEFMLQQTQVKTVLPYFARWLETLPDFTALARATPEVVLKLWEGLGYYSRARNLHRLAREITPRMQPPQSVAEWCALPGIGPYTAAAIASITFGTQAACVDGNVVRILARLTRNDTLFRDSASAAREFAHLATALLPASAPGDHNQAMMELGATVCLRQKPLCLVCPVRSFCAAARSNKPEAFPRFVSKQTEQRQVTRVWCESGGSILLHRAPDKARRFAGMHELPSAELAGFDNREAVQGALLLRKRRAITRFQITESIHTATAPDRDLRPDLVWVPIGQLDTVTLSGPHRRWVAEILARRIQAGVRPSALQSVVSKRGVARPKRAGPVRA